MNSLKIKGSRQNSDSSDIVPKKEDSVKGYSLTDIEGKHYSKNAPLSVDKSAFFVKRKPRDSRVVEKRLTDEKNPPNML